MNSHFFPETTPYSHEMLAVDAQHTLYIEQCGNPNGIPILFLHGGPGAGCSTMDRSFFDPVKFRVILFDQRGCGRSEPAGEIDNNSPQDIVADIEKIRQHLDIDRWHVFGGSWGSTISLLYAQAHPQAVLSLVLRGIWLMRDEEIDWWLYQAKFIQTEIWNRFNEHIDNPEERDNLLEAYWQRLNSADKNIAQSAAMAWSNYEASCCTLEPNDEFLETLVNEHTAWCMARMEASYFRHHRPTGKKAILNHLDAIRHIPAFAVHGRYDIVCPIKSLFDLADAWPELDTEVVVTAGHSSHEPGITEQLVAATNRIAITGSPQRTVE